MKIFSRLLQPCLSSSSSEMHAVVGSDSDLFLMALLQNPSGNLWILPDSRDKRAKRSPLAFSLQALDNAWSSSSLPKSATDPEVR